jgi:flagellar hook-associated protein 3 FlgL
MRVSTSMIYQQLTDKMSDNSAAMAKLQSALSSGSKFTRASEAPSLAGRVQSFESRLATLEADRQAISRVRIGVDAQSRALQLGSELMDRLKQLAFQGANDPVPQSQLDAIAEELVALKRSFVDLTNTRDADDRYVFGGTRSGAPPYVLNNDGTVDYIGSTTPLRVRVNDVGFEDATTSGPSIWKGIERDNNSIGFFEVLSEFESALRENRLDGRQQALRDIEVLNDNVGVAMARAGGIQQRLDIAERQAEEITIRARESLSDLKDLDYATALTQLQQQELLMQASQSMMSRLSQLSLLDALR